MADWKSDLDSFFSKKEKRAEITKENVSKADAEIESFFSSTVIPAFEEMKLELEKHQRVVNISSGGGSASIEVSFEGNSELRYSIKTRIHSDGSIFLYPETRFRDKSDGKKYVAEGYLRSGSQNYVMKQITKDEIINHFLSEYKLQVNYPQR
jgi:hypothetical protein